MSKEHLEKSSINDLIENEKKYFQDLGLYSESPNK